MKLIFLILLFSIISTYSNGEAVNQPDRIENVSDRFVPSNWMGDYGDLILNLNYTNNSFSKPNCVEIIYTAARSSNAGWAEIYWVYPPHNRGGEPGHINIFNGAKKLTFWARGKQGGEIAEFKMGGIAGEYSDSVRPAISTGLIVLSNNWTQYEIDLTGMNLSQVIGGFCWISNGYQNPVGCTLYLDDMRYVW